MHNLFHACSTGCRTERAGAHKRAAHGWRRTVCTIPHLTFLQPHTALRTHGCCRGMSSHGRLGTIASQRTCAGGPCAIGSAAALQLMHLPGCGLFDKQPTRQCLPAHQRWPRLGWRHLRCVCRSCGRGCGLLDKHTCQKKLKLSSVTILSQALRSRLFRSTAQDSLTHQVQACEAI